MTEYSFNHFYILPESMSKQLLLLFLFLCSIFLGFLVYSVSLPRGFPRNIPIISIYTQVYDTLRGVSKSDFYNTRIREHVEKRGAVGLWQHGQWTVLLTKPEYITEMFRDKNSCLKRNGSYHRRPGSALARLFGENIIDSDGDLHNHFTSIIKPGIVRRHNITSIKTKSSQLASQLLQDQITLTSGTGTPVSVPIFQWSASLYGEYFLDLKFDQLKFEESNFQAILRAQNRSIIGRIKNLFPILDRLPWKWKITRRTGELLDKLETMLVDHTTRRLKQPPSPGGEDKVIYRMSQARENGIMSEFHYRCNMNQLFVAGAENVESALISAMLELAKSEEIQEQLHFELVNKIPPEYSEADLNKLPLLTAVVYETLRLYPPIGTMTNRRTKESYSLGDDIVVPEGILIGRHVYGTHTDPEVWHDSTAAFNPRRWGEDFVAVNNMFRAQQVRGRFIPFGLHARRCLGSSFAITQLKIALCELVLALKWTLPADYRFSFSTVGVVLSTKCANYWASVANFRTGSLDDTKSLYPGV